MEEKIYTIPVNEEFEKSGDCPFCRLYKKLESNEISLITGASMMEPDIRIKTNEMGFCKKHFEKICATKEKLPVALVIQTHLDKIRGDLKKNPLTLDFSQKVIKRLEKLEDDCYVCERINRHFIRMTETVCLLFEKEKKFREMFASQKTLCLPHLLLLLQTSRNFSPKKTRQSLETAALELSEKNLNDLYDDISLFCKKFDYNHKDLPWGDSKDAIERSLKFITSDI